MNRTLRILSAALLIVPSLAQAAYYPTSYGVYSRAMFTQTVMDRTGGARDGTNCFPDVTTQSYASAVCAAKLQGIVSGGADGYFRPDTPIAFVEAAAIVLRADGFHATSGSPWYRSYLEEVADRDAIPQSVNNILDPITASQAEELINEVLNGSSGSSSSHHSNSSGNQKDNNDDDEIDLSIDVSDNTVEPDDTVTFRIRLKNVDNDDLDNIDVTAEFDEDEFEFVSASDSGDLQSNDEEVEWDSIDVDEDETTTILLTLRVDEDADEDDRFDIHVEVEDSEATSSVRIEEDDNDRNDDDAVRLTVTDSPDPVEPGENIRYTIKIENMEDDDISVDIRAILDTQVDFVSASNGGDEERNEVVWSNIDLDEDEEETVTLTVRVDSSADDGDTIRLDVTANDDEETESTRVDDNGSNNNNTGDEDIDVSITDSDDPAEIGDIVEYRIKLENQEDEDVSIDVVAELDEGMSFIDASNGGDEDDDEVRWEDIDIDEDDDRTITLKVRINSDADDGDTLTLKVSAGDGDDEEDTEIDD